MRKVLLLILVAAVSTTTCWCVSRDSDETHKEKRGGKAVIALPGAPEALFPFSIRDYNSYEISRRLLHPALTSGDARGPQPILARAWQTNKDNSSITYFLDKKLRWSDGKPFSASDVIASFDFIKEHAEQASPALRLEIVDSVALQDSFTVRFFLSRPVADPAMATRFPILPAELLMQKSWQQLQENPPVIGCGPFLLRHAGTDSLLLVANDMYPERPFIDTLLFRFYADDDTLEKWLSKRVPDLAPNVSHTLHKKLRGDAFYTTETTLERGFTFLGWNLRHPILKEKTVRKALRMAIDRQTITDGVMSGYAQVQDVPAYPEFWAYQPGPSLKYDPARSNDILDSLSIARAGAEIQSRNTVTLEPAILVNADNSLRVEVAKNIASYWQALGLNASVETVPWSSMLKRLQQGNYDVALISWVADEVFDPTELFHSQSISTDNNFMYYQNSLLDTHLVQALNHPNKEQRRFHWQAFQRIIVDDMPVTVMFNRREIHLVSQRLKDIRINSRSYLTNSKEWWLDGRK